MIKKAVFMFLCVCLMIGTSRAGTTRSSEYAAIQDAAKKEKSDSAVKSDKVLYFRLEVFENGKSTVKIKIPLALVELAAKDDDDGAELMGGTGKDLHLNRILAELKKGGANAPIEIEDKGELVRIWIE